MSNYFRTEIDGAWTAIGLISADIQADTLKLGALFLKLRDLYSDRNSGGHRLTSGHGVFEQEIQQRGYKTRTVRQWIGDFQAHQIGAPSSSAKRAARRRTQKTSVKTYTDAVVRFASILPYAAAKAAYREAAKMQELNSIWEEVQSSYYRSE
jgi:hypothetical protein